MTAAPHYDWSFSFPRLRRELRAGSRDVLQQDQCPVYRWDPMPTGFKILYFLIPYSQQCSSALCPAVLLLSLVATSAFPVLVSGAAGAQLEKCFCPWLWLAFPSWMNTRLFPGLCPQLSSCVSLRSPKCSLIISPNNCVIALTELFQMPKLILLFMPSFISNGILITSRIQKYWINLA